MKTIITILFTVLIIGANAQIQSQGSGNWNNSATWVGGIVPNNANTSVIIQNNHTITLTSNVTIGSIEIIDGSINLNANKLSIYGEITGLESNNVNSNANTELEILENIHSLQFEFPNNIQKLKKLTINRSLGAFSNHDLDLDDIVPADGKVLVLTNGILYMNNGSILYLNSKQIEADIPSSNVSHIDGIVQRNIPKNSGIFTFPVGNKGFSRPFGVGLQNGNSDNINQVHFIYEKPVNSENVDYSKLPGGIIQYFYWKHNVISGGNPQRRLSYEESDFPNITSQERINSMTLANTNGSQNWDKATTGWSVNDNKKYIEFDNANASNSTFWTLGSILGDVSYEEIRLPITFLYLTSALDETGVILNWATASEENNFAFIIERSANGIDFYPIGKIAGANNSNTNKIYSFYDENPLPNISYYRLKQIDTNEKFSYSEVISAIFEYKQILCSILPYKQNIWNIIIKGNISTTAFCSLYTMKGHKICEIPLHISQTAKTTVNFNDYIINQEIIYCIITIDNSKFSQKIYIVHF